MKVEVYALCTTPYHLLQILGLCEWLKLKSLNPELFIYQNKFLGNYRVTPGIIDEAKLTYPIQFKKYPGVKKRHIIPSVLGFIVRTLLIKKSDSILICPNGVHIGFLSFLGEESCKPNTFFSIEDGLGTYGTLVHRTRTKTRESTSKAKFPLFLFGELLRLLLQRIATLRSGAIFETITTRGGWGEHVKLTPHVKELLKLNVFQWPTSKIPEQSALFLSQPLVEIGVMNKRQYLKIIQDVSDYFTSMGCHFYVKPHPSEDAAKFSKFHIINFEGPVEVFFSTQRKNIAHVSGINSTALVLAHKIFNIPAYRIESETISRANFTTHDEEISRLLEESTTPLLLDEQE